MVNGEFAEIFPTRAINITAALANYSPEQVYVHLKGEELNTSVSKDRILIPAEASIISGVVLTTAWMFQRRKIREKR